MYPLSYKTIVIVCGVCALAYTFIDAATAGYILCISIWIWARGGSLPWLLGSSVSFAAAFIALRFNHTAISSSLATITYYLLLGYLTCETISHKRSQSYNTPDK